MRNNNDIESIFMRVLSEEIEKKSKSMTSKFGEWTEIDANEELHGGQKKLDVAKPKGKLTSDDFKKLRSRKKEEVDEMGDRTPKMIGSFDDEGGWYDDMDYRVSGDVFPDYDEEEFDDFDDFDNKYGKEQMWFKGGDGKKFFDLYKNKHQKPLKVRKPKSFDESETQEGNAFVGAVKDAKEKGEDSFTFKGEKFDVKEGKEKWIQKTKMKKGELHKKLNIPEDEKIPVSKLKSLKKELMNKDKKSASDLKLLKQVNLALTLKDIKESNNSVRLTENELIDLIEDIAKKEMKDVTDLDNLSIKTPQGLNKTKKVQEKSKKSNDDYVKSVIKKMKEYLKPGSESEYEENPTSFPKGNGELGEMKKKAYKASDAVEEYIEAFAYPGLEETRPDEIKGNEEWMEANIKGSSKTGNGDWANSVKTDLGEKINKKRKEKPYQREKDRSYNRVTQPVDDAGEGKGQDKLDRMFAKLESREDKKTKLVSEELNKMKNLYSYNRKTQ